MYKHTHAHSHTHSNINPNDIELELGRETFILRSEKLWWVCSIKSTFDFLKHQLDF